MNTKDIEKKVKDNSKVISIALGLITLITVIVLLSKRDS